jgi:phosphoribosyl 1,2-cyclic phosphodiesterase
MSKENFAVKFWGVRGSHPTPGPETIRYGGNTACIEVRLGSHIIILDAGTGIIPLGRDLAYRARQSGLPLELMVLFSHLHHDHTQGFPFFIPAYVPSADLRLYGPGACEASLQQVLENNQNPDTFPVSLRDMSASKDIHSLRENETLYLDVDGTSSPMACIKIHKSYAHPGGSYAYRIEWRGRSLVYATDTEGYQGGDKRLAAFARGADLLIHDAQYADEHYYGQIPGLGPTQGYGHSTISMACELAAQADVKQLALFHYDPSYDDIMVSALEARARELFEHTVAAAEGLELDVAGAESLLAVAGDRSNVPARAARTG